MPTNPTTLIRRERPEERTVSAQFDQLIKELIAGKIERGRFEIWEIGILLDSLSLSRITRPFLLRQYHKAVQRQLESGAALPMGLSQFLASREN